MKQQVACRIVPKNRCGRLSCSTRTKQRRALEMNLKSLCQRQYIMFAGKSETPAFDANSFIKHDHLRSKSNITHAKSAVFSAAVWWCWQMSFRLALFSVFWWMECDREPGKSLVKMKNPFPTWRLHSRRNSEDVINSTQESVYTTM